MLFSPSGALRKPAPETSPHDFVNYRVPGLACFIHDLPYQSLELCHGVMTPGWSLRNGQCGRGVVISKLMGVIL